WLLHTILLNDTATTDIYTLSLHDALPISSSPIASMSLTKATARNWSGSCILRCDSANRSACWSLWSTSIPPYSLIASEDAGTRRSEEHTSELQSLAYLVCRLLLEKKKIIY